MHIFIKMKKELFQTIEIPEEVEATLKGTTLTIKGKEGENKRIFDIGFLEFKKENNKIVIGSKKATKKEKRVMNAIAAHIKNMIKGVQEKFKYELKICFSHFPITVNIDEDKAIIKNLLV